MPARSAKKRFIAIAVIFQSLFAISILICGLVLQQYLRQNSARILADTVSADVKKNELREAMSVLSAAQIESFRSARFIDRTQHVVFSVPPSMGTSKSPKRCHWFMCPYPEVTMPLFADADGTKIYGFLIFEYSSIHIYIGALFVWLLWVGLTIPLAIRLLRKILEVEKMKFSYELSKQVSHDIRSPIGAIRMAVQRLPPGVPTRELIEKSALRIKEIADDLLKNSKLQSQDKLVKSRTFSNTPFPVISLIEELVTERRQTLVSNVEIIIDVPDTAAGACLAIDKGDLGRSLMNLINNAVEAIESEGRVTVSLRVSSQGLAIVVTDNGKGIESTILAEIGKRGFSFGKEGYEPSGDGLGVSSAKSVVENAGGKFMIQSKVGAGTMVTLHFPIRTQK